MKWLLGILSFFVLLCGALYILVFTPPGNNLLRSVIEKKINDALHVKSTLETFVLNSDTFRIVLALDDANRIEATGNYALFTQAFNIAYRVRLEKLENLKPLTGEQLFGTLHTEGSAVGDMEHIAIEGTSDLAHSQSRYNVTLEHFQPQRVTLDIKDARTEALLSMLGRAPYAPGALHVNAEITSLDPANLQGTVALKLENGRIDTKLMQRDFNLTLPETEFSMQNDLQLRGPQLAYQTRFDSNLARIASEGNVAPETLATQVAFNLDFKELGLLTPLTGTPLRGPLHLEGTVSGDRERMSVKGSSDIARSQTRFDALLEKLQPKTVHAQIRHLDLPALLHMAVQPHYLESGLLNMSVQIDDATPQTLKGRVNTHITRGSIDPLTTARSFALDPMPPISFTASTDSQLHNTKIISRIDLNASLMNLGIQSARFDTATQTLESDYLLMLKDLAALQFATKQKMQGAMTFDGTIKKAKDLDLSAHAETLGGTINATVHNDDLKARLQGLQTLPILHMLYYPEVFSSALEGTLSYDLKTKNGTLDAQLSDGKFTKNDMADLLKQYAKYDLYKDRFTGQIKSTLAPELITSALALKGGSVTINDPKMVISTKSEQIKSDLKVSANNNPLLFKLRGPISKPDVSVDASELIEREAGKELNKLFKSLF